MVRRILLGLCLLAAPAAPTSGATCFFDGVTPESVARDVPIVFRGVPRSIVDYDGDPIPVEVFREGLFVFDVVEVLKGELPAQIKVHGQIITSASVTFTLGEDYILPVAHHRDDRYAVLYCDAYYVNDERDAILAELRRYDDETAALERALILDPAQPDALARLVALLADFREYERALPYLDDLVGLDPSRRALRIDIVEAAAAWLIEGRDRERALALLDQLAAREPGNADVQARRADTLLGLDRHDEALAGYRAALALEPGHAEARHGETLTLVALDRVAELDSGIRDFSGLVAHSETPIDFAGVQLQGADFTGSYMKAADFSRADLTGAVFNGVRIGSGDFTGAVLRDASFRLRDIGGIFRDADLRGAVVSGNLRSAVFDRADLTGATLDEAVLERASLVGARALGAGFRRTLLREADLSEADLRGADLSGADLYEASLDRADLSDADLSGANLNAAELTGTVLEGTRYDCATLWPVGFDPVASGAATQQASCAAPSDAELWQAMATLKGEDQPAPIAHCLTAPTVTCITDLILIATDPAFGERPYTSQVLWAEPDEIDRATRNLFDVGRIDAAAIVARRAADSWDADYQFRDRVPSTLILAEVQAVEGDREDVEAVLAQMAQLIRIVNLDTNQRTAPPSLRPTLMQHVAASWLRLGDAEAARRLIDEVFPELLRAQPPGQATGSPYWGTPYVERMPLYDLRDIALVHIAQGNFAAALAAAADIRAAADAYRLEPGPSGFRTHIAQIYSGTIARIADLLAEAGGPSAAAALLERAQQVISTALPEEMIIRELMAYGPTDRVRGFPELDEAFEREGAFLGDYAGEDERAAFVANIRRLIDAGDHFAAIVTLDQAVGAVTAAADPCAAMLAYPLPEIAYLWARLGEPDRALAALTEMRAMTCREDREHGAWIGELVGAHGVLAGALYAAGRPEDSRNLLAEAKAMLRPFDAGTRLFFALGDIAIQQARTGDPEGARVTLYGALQDVLARPGSTRHQGGTCCIVADQEIAELALAAAHAGLFDTAERIANVLATWPDASFSMIDVRDAAEATVADIAVALAAAGRLDSALGLADGLPAGSHARALARIARDLAVAGQPAAAQPHFDHSLRLIPDPLATLDTMHGSATRATWLVHTATLAMVADALGQRERALGWLDGAFAELRPLTNTPSHPAAAVTLAEAEVAIGAPDRAAAILPRLIRRLDYQVADQRHADALIRIAALAARIGDPAPTTALLETFAARYFIEYGSESQPATGKRLRFLAAMLPILAVLERQ